MRGQLKELSTVDLGAGELPQGASTDWELPEDGRRWALGRKSVLRMPVPPVDADLLLLFTVDPFVCAALPKQTMRVVVNGSTTRLARFGRRAVIAARVARPLFDSAAQLEVSFEHPEIIQPNMVSDSTDSRNLSVGFVSLSVASWHDAERQVAPAEDGPSAQRGPPPPDAALSDAELMPFFSSLGDNCEFGMAQRMAGAEPMDLLRFAALPVGELLRGIKDGFAEIENLNDLQFEVRIAGGRREYILYQRNYGLNSHTTVFEGEMGAARLFRREVNKLAVLGRLFRADLREARRIFVFKRNDVVAADYVLPILDALRRWGPNTLLHVVQADGLRPPGTVERIGEGLLRGYIDRFSTYDNAATPPSPVWLDICRKSYRLWQQDEVGSMFDTAGQLANE